MAPHVSPPRPCTSVKSIFLKVPLPLLCPPLGLFTGLSYVKIYIYEDLWQKIKNKINYASYARSGAFFFLPSYWMSYYE